MLPGRRQERGDGRDGRGDRADLDAGPREVPLGTREVVLHVDDEERGVAGCEHLLVALEHTLAEDLPHRGAQGIASGRIGAPVAPRIGMQAPTNANS